MKAYTIALATRLKRRIFNAGNIPLDVIGLIRDVLKERGLALSGYKFYDYGVVLCLECTDQEEAAKVSTAPVVEPEEAKADPAVAEPDADYEKEAEELAAPTPTPATVTKTEDADEAYIDEMLANIPDWDSI
jgi:hypothetical protein